MEGKGKFQEEEPDSERKQCMKDRPACEWSRRGDRANGLPWKRGSMGGNIFF